MEALSSSIPLFNNESMRKVCSRSSWIRFVCVWHSYPWQKAAKEINLDLGLLIHRPKTFWNVCEVGVCRSNIRPLRQGVGAAFNW